MIAQNFVDEIIPDWQLQLDETHRITIRSTIVYLVPVSQAQFTKALASLGGRQAAFSKELSLLSERKGALRVIDNDTTIAARQSLSKKHGENFLDKFIYDTERAIVPEIGAAIRRINGRGVRTSPDRADAAVSIAPARSFRSAADLAKFEQKRGSTWSPTVRLELLLSLEGPREQVELSVDDVRTAMLFCGPLTSFIEIAGVADHHQEPVMRLQLTAP